MGQSWGGDDAAGVGFLVLLGFTSSTNDACRGEHQMLPPSPTKHSLELSQADIHARSPAVRHDMKTKCPRLLYTFIDDGITNVCSRTSSWGQLRRGCHRAALATAARCGRPDFQQSLELSARYFFVTTGRSPPPPFGGIQALRQDLPWLLLTRGGGLQLSAAFPVTIDSAAIRMPERYGIIALQPLVGDVSRRGPKVSGQSWPGAYVAGTFDKVNSKHPHR